MNFIADDFFFFRNPSCVQELMKELINEAFFLFVFLSYIIGQNQEERRGRMHSLL
jgi:hypothetical protein